MTGKKELSRRETFLPFSAPWLDESEIEAVSAVLRSNWLTTSAHAMEFEEEFARYVGSPHALAFNSCTGGLHCALAALGICPEDEVIVPTMTFAATANIVCHLGAKPVFIDVDPQTMNMDVDQIEGKIGRKTRAIIPVHYGGRPCPMDRIMKIGRAAKLFVIEDAAHALGAKYRDRMIGSLPSDVACFSFYPTKCITTGEGGMNTTASLELAEGMKVWRLHGMSRDAWNRYKKGGSWRYDIIAPGFKYNLTDIASAIGLVQLKKAEFFQERRERLAQLYFQHLSSLPLSLPPPFLEGRHSWHLFPIKLKLEELACTRDEFVEELARENIGASVHFIPLHLMSYYQESFGYREGDFPQAEEAFRRLVSLPLFARMAEEDLLAVVQAVRGILERWAR